MHSFTRGQLRRYAFTAAAVAAIALGAVACGGGSSTPTPVATTAATATTAPTSAPTAVATAAATTAATATPTATATGPLTLTVASVSPNPASAGATVTVTFQTQPAAVIGLQVVDGGGNVVAQNELTAGTDGKAVFSFPAKGTAGTWTVSAAAGATVQDLLQLQASPVAGPNTADATFTVQ